MLDEVTLSHLLRKENSFIPNGITYTDLLCGFLEKHLMFPENVSILEIGPGLGDVALGIKNFMETSGRKYSYKAIDISEKILDNMKELDFDTMQSDCLNTRTDEKFDLIIVNEVVSDLPTLVDFNMKTEKGELVIDAKRMISKYGLDVPEYDFNFNYGAIKLIENFENLLHKGGSVFLSEQSSGDGRPRKIPVRGHDEYTIDFSHLEKVAKINGYATRRGDINQILGIDEQLPFVAGVLRPDIKELYNLDKNNRKMQELMTGIFNPDEFTSKLVDVGALNIYNIEKYGQFIRQEAKPIGILLNQFEFLLLRK